MYEQVYSNPDIYKIYIPLPNNPLQNLNSYLIKTPTANLLIDTGFRKPECLAAMQEGLRELNVDMSKTSLFLTHFHADHIGLATAIMPQDSVIYMGDIDYAYYQDLALTDNWRGNYSHAIAEGYSMEAVKEMTQNSSEVDYIPREKFNVTTVTDGEKLQLGEYEFTCVRTPGHTPGHTCLYLAAKKLMFLGDHVLFNITPNIAHWPGVEDSLGDYLASLDKISQFDIEVPLPAHRRVTTDVATRVEQIKAHHQRRFNDIIAIVTDYPGLNAYEIASYMKWSMRGLTWEEFPAAQHFFALGETSSHLDNLRLNGIVYRTVRDGIFHYYLTDIK